MHMDELRQQGKERCFDRHAHLAYSSYDSDNDSNHSVKRKTGSLGGILLRMVALIYDCMCMLACTGTSKARGLSLFYFEGESREILWGPPAGGGWG
jgi:hypothetical protein